MHLPDSPKLCINTPADWLVQSDLNIQRVGAAAQHTSLRVLSAMSGPVFLELPAINKMRDNHT